MNLFKGKTKGKFMKAAGIFLAVASLMGSMSSVAFAAEEPTPKAPANGEKIWSVDPFSAEYSSGYFCVKNATGHGLFEIMYGRRIVRTGLSMQMVQTMYLVLRMHRSIISIVFMRLELLEHLIRKKLPSKVS